MYACMYVCMYACMYVCMVCIYEARGGALPCGGVPELLNGSRSHIAKGSP